MFEKYGIYAKFGRWCDPLKVLKLKILFIKADQYMDRSVDRNVSQARTD